jgi:hypothetical protein
MWTERNYLDDARKYEQVFRNILRSLGAESRGVKPDTPLEKIFQEYSTGDRYGKWTILDFRVGPFENPFTRLSENEALFASEDIASLSGSGRADKYRIKPDGSVELDSNITLWRS